MATTRVESRTIDLKTADGRGRHTNTEVRYLVAGDGPPVVLLHGLGLDSATVSWRYLIRTLASDRRVYAVDFPGHGDSDKPRVRYTTEFFRSVLDAFLQARDLEGAPLVGISMGGSVALSRALDEPVERLVLVDSYGLGEDAPWRPAAGAMLRVPGGYRRWWSSIGASRRNVRRHLRTVVADEPPTDLVEDVYGAVQDAAVGRTVSSWQRSEFRAGGFETCFLDRLDDLETEALFVHGAVDPLIPASWSEQAAKRVDGQFALFDDCGHWPPREAPARFAATVDAFLN